MGTFLYNFGVKYWALVDQDNSNGLNYDEYKYTMAAFAAVDARVILAGFDADDNGILEGDELSAWKSLPSRIPLSKVMNSPHGNHLSKERWPNGTGTQLTLTSVPLNPHGLMLKPTVMPTLALWSKLPNSSLVHGTLCSTRAI